jgi:general nucleoside transport system permease protein
MDLGILVTIFDSALRLSIPLLAACLAGLWSERSGVVDIGLEGKMLVAAFAGAAGAYAFGSAWLGLLAGILASVVFGLVHGFASISQRGNQIVSGVAINMLAAGLTAIVGNAWYGQGGRTPPLEGDQRFEAVLFGHSALVYVVLLAVPVTWFVLGRTRFGLRLRAVGENPAAVDTAGISVAGLRYTAVIIAGVLCGLAGAYLSVGQAAGFLPNMTAGRGFIALAVVIFGGWRPYGALAGACLFGFSSAVAQRLPAFSETLAVLFQALPYVLVLIVVAGLIGRSRPPAAIGIPYVKE